MFKLVESMACLSHDPMDNNVEKRHQCSVITAKILANCCRFRKKGKYGNCLALI